MAHFLELYDTTLRDGTQAENFNLSVDDKIRITLALDELGIDFIEGGWPGSNPVSVEYFQKNAGMSTCSMPNSPPSARPAIFKNKTGKRRQPAGPARSQDPAITIFGKSWDIHVRDALHIELEDNLLIIEDSLAFLRPRVEHLLYDAEHFFDGFKNNPEIRPGHLGKAVAGGAETLILCDTNGGTLPHEIRRSSNG